VSDQLEHLRPAGGKHAIEEVVFEINLATEPPLQVQKYESILSDLLKDDLPKFENKILTGIHVTDDTVRKEEPELTGFALHSFKKDGSVQFRLHSMKGPPEGQSWVAINILEYSRWNKIKPKALRWLEAILEVQEDLVANGITLNYIDRFYWDSEDPFPADDVFQFKESNYVPTALQDNQIGWSSRLSFAHKEDGFTQTDTVAVAHEFNQVHNFSRATVSMPLRVVFNEARTYAELFSEGSVNELFDKLHNDNKRILADILKPEIQDMIELEIGTDT
jgi:uncharacterized protein (TIGR04255 family)